MTIQFNTDKTLDGDKRQQDYFSSQIKEELERFSSHITRIEVHLKDVNGKKEGPNDISCLMEVRLQGKQPIAVKNEADSVKLAVSGAIEKSKTALTKIVGKMQSH